MKIDKDNAKYIEASAKNLNLSPNDMLANILNVYNTLISLPLEDALAMVEIMEQNHENKTG